MFDLASKLVGIYKTDNTTKTVVMQNEAAKSSNDEANKVRHPSGSAPSGSASQGTFPSGNVLQATQTS